MGGAPVPGSAGLARLWRGTREPGGTAGEQAEAEPPCLPPRAPEAGRLPAGGGAEPEEERADRVQHASLRRQQLAHVQDQLLRRDTLALRVLLLERRAPLLALSRGFHEAAEVGV